MLPSVSTCSGEGFLLGERLADSGPVCDVLLDCGTKTFLAERVQIGSKKALPRESRQLYRQYLAATKPEKLTPPETPEDPHEADFPELERVSA